MHAFILQFSTDIDGITGKETAKEHSYAVSHLEHIPLFKQLTSVNTINSLIPKQLLGKQT
jgi:hypothetical protein